MLDKILTNNSKSISRVPIPHEIWVLVSAAFIIALGFGLIAPLLPQYAQSFDVSVFAVSFVISSFAIARLCFAPIAGRLVSGLYGFDYRRTYLTGLAIVATSTMFVGLAQEYWQLIAVRALGGIGSTMFTVSAMGLIVRIAPPQIRGKASSTYGSAFLLGNVFGPLLGALMAPLGMRVPFFIYGAAVFLALAVVYWRLNPEALAKAVPRSTAPTMRFTEALINPTYRAVLASGFSNGWINFGIRMSIVPLFALYVVPGDVAVAGLALTAYAVGNIIALQFSGSLSDRIGRKPVAISGLILNAAFVLGVSFSTTEWWLCASMAGIGFGAGLINPAQQAALADVIGTQRQGGTVLANFQMSMDCGAILGPLIVGVLVDHGGYRVGFIVSSVIACLATVMWVKAQETAPAVLERA